MTDIMIEKIKCVYVLKGKKGIFDLDFNRNCVYDWSNDYDRKDEFLFKEIVVILRGGESKVVYALTVTTNSGQFLYLKDKQKIHDFPLDVVYIDFGCSSELRITKSHSYSMKTRVHAIDDIEYHSRVRVVWEKATDLLKVEALKFAQGYNNSYHKLLSMLLESGDGLSFSKIVIDSGGSIGFGRGNDGMMFGIDREGNGGTVYYCVVLSSILEHFTNKKEVLFVVVDYGQSFDVGNKAVCLDKLGIFSRAQYLLSMCMTETVVIPDTWCLIGEDNNA